MEGSIDQFIALVDFGHGVGICTRGAPPTHLALAIYVRELEKMIFRTMRQALGAHSGIAGAFCPVFPNSERARALALTIDLRRRIHQLAARPVTRNQVERALRISSQECSRWTKNGRLPRAGQITISHTKGQRIQVYTYDPARIDELAAHPEVIESWRRIDQEEHRL